MKTDDRVLVDKQGLFYLTHGKPHWWQFRLKRRIKAVSGSKNGIYIIFTGSWEKKP